MNRRSSAVVAAVIIALALIALGFSGSSNSSAQAASGVAVGPNPCPSAAVVFPTSLPQLPEVDVESLPKDASGFHKLTMNASNTWYKATSGTASRYCYTWQDSSGRELTAPPVIRVRAGDQFALNLVNKLTDGPGVHAKAMAMAMNEPQTECPPMDMPVGDPTARPGYLDHVYLSFGATPTPSSQDTNIHMHGFLGPPQQDNIFLSTLRTQDHSCLYRYVIPTMGPYNPKPQPPGMNWYHSHAHGISNQQVGGGLDGTWIVDPPQGRAFAPADERIIVLRTALANVEEQRIQDVQHAEHMVMPAVLMKTRAPEPTVSFDPFNPPPWKIGMGLPSPSPAPGAKLDSCLPIVRSTPSAPDITVNGIAVPMTTASSALHTQAALGRPQLWRMLNATANSYAVIELHDSNGALQKMQVVGRDGTPVSPSNDDAFALSVPMERVELPPGGRVEFIVTPTNLKPLTVFMNTPCTGPDGTYDPARNLVQIDPVVRRTNAASKTVATTIAKPGQTRADELVSWMNAHPQSVVRRAVTFTQYLYQQPDKKNVVLFFITETSKNNFHEHPFHPAFRPGEREPANPDIIAHSGTVEEWTLFNATAETHAFHIHQMVFTVLNPSDPQSRLELDTLPIHPGTFAPDMKAKDPWTYPYEKPERITVVMDLRHMHPGTFVFHCHMLAHEDRGMMGTIRIVQ